MELQCVGSPRGLPRGARAPYSRTATRSRTVACTNGTDDKSLFFFDLGLSLPLGRMRPGRLNLDVSPSDSPIRMISNEPGNFIGGTLVPISKEPAQRRPGGVPSCLTATRFYSLRPLSSLVPLFSSRPSELLGKPPPRQVPANPVLKEQRHPHPRIAGCTSALSVRTPRTKPSASTSPWNC